MGLGGRAGENPPGDSDTSLPQDLGPVTCGPVAAAQCPHL